MLEPQDVSTQFKVTRTTSLFSFFLLLFRLVSQPKPLSFCEGFISLRIQVTIKTEDKYHPVDGVRFYGSGKYGSPLFEISAGPFSFNICFSLAAISVFHEPDKKGKCGLAPNYSPIPIWWSEEWKILHPSSFVPSMG